MPSKSSLAPQLRYYHSVGLDVTHETARALGAALDALRRLRPTIDIDAQFESHEGSTSVRAVIDDGQRMNNVLNEILAGSGTLTDSACIHQINDLLDFSFELHAAQKWQGLGVQSSEALSKDAVAFFEGIATLKAMADTYSAGFQAGLRERKSGVRREVRR